MTGYVAIFKYPCIIGYQKLKKKKKQFNQSGKHQWIDHVKNILLIPMEKITFSHVINPTAGCTSTEENLETAIPQIWNVNGLDS